MAWKVYCKHCDLLFPVEHKTIPSSQAGAEPAQLLLMCKYCGHENAYTTEDLVKANAQGAAN